MKISLVLAACMAVSAASMPAASAAPHSPVFIAQDAAQPITVAPGDQFFIALASNVTTGYSWTSTIGDGKVLAYEGVVYQPPSSDRMGAGGQQIFIFHANRSGNTTIVLNYGQPFDPNKAVTKSVTFNVTVQ